MIYAWDMYVDSTNRPIPGTARFTSTVKTRTLLTAATGHDKPRASAPSATIGGYEC